MWQEVKISLPFYKIAYAIFFVVILSLIRGVSLSYEIGIALEAPMAILAAVFCADTYAQEFVSKRSEICQLYPMKKRVSSIIRRIAVQELCLILFAVAGYGLFYFFQNPLRMHEMDGIHYEAEQFVIYAAAIVITLLFWGILSNTIAIFFHNMWAGMGGCLLLWIMTNSTVGDELLGSWNLFSYTFRNIENYNDFAWLSGKILSLGLVIVMAVLLPKLLKKRG